MSVVVWGGGGRKDGGGAYLVYAGSLHYFTLRPAPINTTTPLSPTCLTWTTASDVQTRTPALSYTRPHVSSENNVRNLPAQHSLLETSVACQHPGT